MGARGDGSHCIVGQPLDEHWLITCAPLRLPYCSPGPHLCASKWYSLNVLFQ